MPPRYYNDPLAGVSASDPVTSTPVLRPPSPYSSSLSPYAGTPLAERSYFSDTTPSSQFTTYHQNAPVPSVKEHAYDDAQSPQLPTPPALMHPPFQRTFFGNHEEAAKRRSAYFKSFGSGIALVIGVVFVAFPIFWGALVKLPAHALQGIVVDFDQGIVGLNVTLGLLDKSSRSCEWSYVAAANFPGGPASVAQAIRDEEAWVAIVINADASQNLNAALLNPRQDYNGTSAITVFANEARQETAFRNFVLPQTVAALDSVTASFAIQLAQQVSTNGNIATILSTSPQTIVQPVYYTINNLLPFHQPVATASTFVGLIYLLILSFFVVVSSPIALICPEKYSDEQMTGYAARQSSGLDKNLRLRSLIMLRLASSFGAYFVISLFYSLLNETFGLTTSATFGRANGFMILWMLNWIGMLSVGLALESVITLATPRYIPFVMVFWIIVNNSVCMNAIELMPAVYKYGYGSPFYNISRGIRTITLGTKNDVGLNFGVLLVWVLVSSVTMPLFQWYVRRKGEDQMRGNGQGNGATNRYNPNHLEHQKTSK
ncbi:hypothetical protein BKA70DRAFT_829109 [Coprinopsis sp. MPI-PUGE-AT-0042]|nr:hypothetical protein BKA70DRAFT_829109 [Coprinopsis sp. MPI-PUGE-AT-0042]